MKQKVFERIIEKLKRGDLYQLQRVEALLDNKGIKQKTLDKKIRKTNNKALETVLKGKVNQHNKRLYVEVMVYRIVISVSAITGGILWVLFVNG